MKSVKNNVQWTDVLMGILLRSIALVLVASYFFLISQPLIQNKSGNMYQVSAKEIQFKNLVSSQKKPVQLVDFGSADPDSPVDGLDQANSLIAGPYQPKLGELATNLAGTQKMLVLRVVFDDYPLVSRYTKTEVLGMVSDLDTLFQTISYGNVSLQAQASDLIRLLGAGNERVYCGREGWLFYRPEVEYLTGPGFLDPAFLARRIATAQEWTRPPQPDPREAIIRFGRQLEARGIALIVMPTPLKPTVHPEKLARDGGLWSAPVQNPSYPVFVEGVRRAGVLVLDVASVLVEERRRTGRPQYLATDTHWRPETMARVAESLGAFIRTHVTLPDLPDPGYRTEQQERQNIGGIAIMLDLPRNQVVYPPEGVSILRVLAADGSPWRPSRSADVLVLGDSFSNIYSLASLGWGDAAGFTEQVSYVLRRPVDRILQNSDGAFATRALLRREIAAGTDRLAGW